uniref:Uncharacterized protein n=1 Tax=Brassica oleracea var. oleracea TaxID=109376 RepID=A0A0D3BWS8_BRAOL
MTWSMFEGFCEDNGSSGSVKHVWYKLPQETMDLLSNAPAARGRGRPWGRGRGCGRGRGREREPPVPRESGCYIGPHFGRVFDVWGPTVVSDQNSQGSQQQPQDS